METIQVELNLPEVGQKVRLVRQFDCDNSVPILVGTNGKVAVVNPNRCEILVTLDALYQPSQKHVDAMESFEDALGPDGTLDGEVCISYYDGHGWELNGASQHALAEFHMSVEYID